MSFDGRFFLVFAIALPPNEKIPRIQNQGINRLSRDRDLEVKVISEAMPGVPDCPQDAPLRDLFPHGCLDRV
jgi:hypothetical protein